jgi:hypothetical protein
VKGSACNSDSLRTNWLLAGAVLHQLDAEKQTLAANITDSLVPHQAPQSVQQIGADIGGAFGSFSASKISMLRTAPAAERVAPLVADKPSITTSTASSPRFFAIWWRSPTVASSRSDARIAHPPSPCPLLQMLVEEFHPTARGPDVRSTLA